jgi:hypothetical protein
VEKMNTTKKPGAVCLLLVGLLSVIFVSTSSEAAISCKAFEPNVAQYPNQGSPATVSHAFLCSNSVTGIVPTTTRAKQVFNTVGDSRFPVAVRSKLKNAKVNYYFFNNRSEADAFFSVTWPYKVPNNAGATVVRGFNGTALGAQCGNTGMISIALRNYIAVAIYNQCAYQTGTSLNPNLPHNTFHESGHAFDFSYASGSAPYNTLSNNTFWTQVRKQDLQNLTPFDWFKVGAWTTQQKVGYICKLYLYSKYPSSLELALGSNANGGPQGQVCQGYSAIFAPYQNMTPTQIAINKINYFVTNNQEIFAAVFALKYWNASSQNFLAFSDSIIGNILIQPRAFNCVRTYMETMILTGSAPVNSAGGYCPAPPSPFY